MAAGIVNMDRMTNRARALTKLIFPDINVETVVATSKNFQADTMIVGQWRIQSCWDRTDWPWFQLWRVDGNGNWVAVPGRWYSFWETYKYTARLEFEERMAAASGAVMQPDLEPTT